MSKKIIYEEIKAKVLTDQPKVKTFRLWNNQIDNLSNEDSFLFPAVFLGFTDLTFMHRSSGIQDIEGTITLYIVQHELRTENLENLDFVDTIAKALNGFQTDTILSPLKRTQERQDIDHDQLIIWEQDFNIKAIDCTSSKFEDSIEIPAETLALDLAAVEEGEGLSLIIQNDSVRTAKNFIDIAAPPAPVGFNPATDTDLVMWYDSTGLAINTNNSFGEVDAVGAVANWKNLKGVTSYDLLQGVTTQKPLLTGSGIEADGVNDFLQSADLPTEIKSLNDFTFVVICEVMAANGQHLVFQGADSHFISSSLNLIVGATANTRAGGSIDNLFQTNIPTIGETNVRFYNNKTNWTIISDGFTALGGSLTQTQNPIVTTFNLGRILNSATTTYLPTKIKEILIFKNEVTNAQKIIDINTYISSKW